VYELTLTFTSTVADDLGGISRSRVSEFTFTFTSVAADDLGDVSLSRTIWGRASS